MYWYLRQSFFGIGMMALLAMAIYGYYIDSNQGMAMSAGFGLMFWSEFFYPTRKRKHFTKKNKKDLS